MQKENPSRSNKERSEVTRTKLLKAARALFIKKGYAETGTPEIVKLAAVTRGALYHHFTDKADLFRVVAEAEAKSVSELIEKKTRHQADPMKALLEGADAYFSAMATPGPVQILLLDCPTVLGNAEINKIAKITGENELRSGLTDALAPTTLPEEVLTALAEVISAAFDRAALAISKGLPTDRYRMALSLILQGLVNSNEDQKPDVRS